MGKTKFRLGDRVKVKEGFYRDYEGILIDSDFFIGELETYNKYKIEINFWLVGRLEIKTAWIREDNLELIREG